MKGVQGTGASKLVQLMRSLGYNKDIDVKIGTVTSAPPDLKVRLDEGALVLESDDLVVSEHLTKHDRQVKINGGAVSTLSYQDELKVNDKVILLEVSEDQMYIIVDRVVTY